jgi:hypothetical protein
MSDKIKSYYGILFNNMNIAYVKEYPGFEREEAIKKCIAVCNEEDNAMSIAEALNAAYQNPIETYIEHFDYDNDDFVEDKGTDALGSTTTHPAYGLIKFNRRTGSRRTLFGSSIEHHDTISLAISQANITRGLNNDWYHAGKCLVEVEMSYAQFADAITSLNVGEGVPCTVTWQNGVGMLPNPPFINKCEQFTDEVSKSLAEKSEKASEMLEKVKDILVNKTSISKADRKTIFDSMSWLAGNFGSSSNEFVKRQFEEQMEKTVHEAKCEIEAFAQNKLLQIANHALVEQYDENERNEVLESPVDISCLENSNIKNTEK